MTEPSREEIARQVELTEELDPEPVVVAVGQESMFDIPSPIVPAAPASPFPRLLLDSVSRTPYEGLRRHWFAMAERASLCGQAQYRVTTSTVRNVLDCSICTERALRSIALTLRALDTPSTRRLAAVIDQALRQEG